MIKKNGNLFPNIRIFGIPVNIWVYCILAVLGLVFWKKIVSVFTSIFAVSSANSALSDYKNQGNTTIEVSSINPQQVARVLWDAIWDNGFGLIEDEETFKNTLLSCPKEYIGKVATEYAKINSKGKILYNDAIKYLSKSDYQLVKHLLS